MIVGTLLSSAAGIFTSFFQDWWKQKLSLKEQERMLEIEIKRKTAGLDIEREKTKQSELALACESEKNIGIKAQNEANIQISQEETKQMQIKSDANTYDNFVNSAVGGGMVSFTSRSKLINFANFWIAITRPNITYLLGFLVAFVQIYILLNPDNFNKLINNTIYLSMTECTFYLFDGCLAYWFLRRTSEKFANIDHINSGGNIGGINPNIKKKL